MENLHWEGKMFYLAIPSQRHVGGSAVPFLGTTLQHLQSVTSLYFSVEAFFLTHRFGSSTVTAECCDVTLGFEPVDSPCQNTVS